MTCNNNKHILLKAILVRKEFKNNHMENNERLEEDVTLFSNQRLVGD